MGKRKKRKAKSKQDWKSKKYKLGEYKKLDTKYPRKEF